MSRALEMSSEAGRRHTPAPGSLVHRLVRRLRPLAWTIGLLISVVFPTAYYVFGVSVLREQARAEGREFVERTRDVVLADPLLRGFQGQKLLKVLHEFLDRGDVMSIRILDTSGNVIASDADPAAPESLSRWSVVWEATPIVSDNQTLGTAEVGLSRSALLRHTLAFLVISVVTGASLAGLVLRLPVGSIQEAEGALRASEASYRTLFDRVPVGLLRSTPDGQFLDANPALVGMLGYADVESLRAVRMVDLYTDPAERTRLREQLERDGFVRDFEVRWRRRDGSELWVKLGVRLVTDDAGRVVYWEGVQEDVTERRRGEDTRSRLAAIVESAEDAIASTTLEGVLVTWNRGAQRLYGYTPAEALGRSSAMLIPEDRVGELGGLLEALGRGETIANHQTVRRRKDGSTVDVSLTLSPIRSEGGAVTGISVVAHDISVRKRAAAAVQRANRALRTLSECNQAIVRATEPGELLRDVCRTLVETGGYRLAWVGWAEDDAAKSVRPLAHAGIEEGYLEGLRLSWADTERGHGVTGTAIRTGRPSVVRDIASDPEYAPWRAEALRRGYRSAAAVPLLLGSRAVGALHISAAEPDAFDAEELELLVELAADTAYGLETLRLRAAHRRVEEALVASERKFRALTENALDIVTVLARDGTIRYESPSVERVLGYAPEELVGRNVVDYVDPDDVRGVADALETVAASPGATASVEARFRHRDGSWRTMEGVGKNLLDDPAVEGIIINSRDITDRRHAEEALRESAGQITRILESIADGFVALDTRGRFTYLNGRAEQFLRRRREDLLGRTMLDAFAEAEGSTFQTQFRKAMAEQTPVDFVEFYRPLSSWFEVHVYPSADGLSVYFRDVTDQRRSEERLRQAEKLTTLGGLISGVAHELNNPLTVVTGFAHMLQGAPDVPERVKRRLGQIDTQAQRAAKIVKNLLTFARQQPPQLGRVRPADLVDQVLDLLAYQLRVNNVAVQKDFSADTPEITADPDQLVQVFVNIVQNAMQAMADGEPRRLAIRIAPVGSGVRLEFQDTGPGIPPAVLGRIFDPFFTTKPQGQGTGLGLSICYGIVQAHRGEIFAENAPERGARFVVELPAGASVEPAPPERAAGMQAEERPRRAEILAVDDESEILSLLVELLGAAGHRVQTAASGRTALARIERGERYDAVMLDVKMPEMDGREVYEALARRFPEVAARVIFATGDVISGDTREFLEASGRPSLMKPFSEEEIARVLGAVLAARDR